MLGTYDSVTNVVHLTKSLTLRGVGGNPEDTIIDGEGLHCGITVHHADSAATRATASCTDCKTKQ